MDKLISIIVPVYNVEKYVEQCIKSILNQTYDLFELILVDDGSTDCGGKICDRYAEMDERIKVIHKVNGGLSEARNVGIEISKGEFITFIDSDDFISTDYLDILINNQQIYDADIVQGDITRTDTDFNNQNKTKPTVLSKSEALSSLLRYKNVKVYAWAKLYRKALFLDNDISYPVGRINEDCATTYKLIYRSRVIVVVSDIIYFYRCTPESILNSKFNIKRMELWKVPEEISNYLAECDIEKYQMDLAYYKFRTGVHLINESFVSSDELIENSRNRILHQLRKLNITYNYFDLKYGFIYVLIHYCPTIYFFIMKRIKRRKI